MLEKVESIKKSNRLVEILSSRKAKYIIGTILLSGIGVALPRIFHVLAGTNAGATVISARRAGTTATYDQLNKYFGITQMPIISSRYWNMVHGATPEDVKKMKRVCKS